MIGLKLISKTVYKLKFVFLGLNLAYFNLDEEASSIFAFCNFNLIFFYQPCTKEKRQKTKGEINGDLFNKFENNIIFFVDQKICC